MNYSLKSAIKLCRLCANTIEDTSSNDLFHKSNKSVLGQIKELTGITVKHMPRQLLPRFFCGECKDELPRAYEFRRKIIKTQSYFKSKEYKNKFEAEEKRESSEISSKKQKINTATETKPLSDDSSDQEEEDFNAEYSPWESNDENPIGSQLTDSIKPKTPKQSLQCDVNVSNKTNHTSSGGTSQTFDAVFLPKKEENLLNKIYSDGDDDDESEKDALEDFAAGSEDPDFIIGLDLKKKYKKKPKSNNATKAAAPKDPRKNPLFCYLCKTTLKTSHAFKVHCRKLHKGEKIFKCDFCEETFLRIKSLIRHSRLHQGGKLFECRYCDMSFNAPTTRIHHERAKHTKDWPFLCPICGKSFITTTRGKEHMTVHTKERPYKCELCKTAYLQRNNFKKHRRSELHKNNEKKLKESMEIAQIETPVSENKIDSTEK